MKNAFELFQCLVYMPGGGGGVLKVSLKLFWARRNHMYSREGLHLGCAQRSIKVYIYTLDYVFLHVVESIR